MLQNILNELSSQIVPIAVTAILGILTAFTKTIVDNVVDLIIINKKSAEQKAGVDKAKDIENTAYKIWLQVDEHFRISQFIGDTIAAKQDMFDRLLLEKVPGLTKQQIENLRQSIAGEVNKGREKITAENAVTIDPQQLQQLQDKAQKFDQLKNTLNPVQPQSTEVN